MNDLAKLLAAIGLLLIGIAAAAYVFDSIYQRQKEENALKYFIESMQEEQTSLQTYESFVEEQNR